MSSSDAFQQRVKDVLDLVGDLPPAERAAALDRECGGDAAVRAEVESLLVHHAAPTADIGSGSAGGSGAGAGDRGRPYHRIGAYRIVREIGRGGMGVVYLARREGDQFRRHFALKVLKRGMDTEDVLRRFDLERQVLAAMNHPGIARLYDGGETEDGTPYFVMEHVEGLEIERYCDVHRLHIDERLDLFRKVCAAVHYAHQNLVVHRDLKPSNIIVTEDGQPKLLDFGIAKIINPQFSLVEGDPTAPELRIMTPEYASPEQVRGHPITTASDVYSLGVLLYEMLCGHAPYRLRTRLREEVERIICEEEPERPSTMVSRVEEFEQGEGGTKRTTTITPDDVVKARESRPERLRRALAGDIDNIVMMAMRKEPQRRYKSAEQMAEDIKRHLEGLPVIARRDTFGYRVSKFVRRNRAGVAAAAVIALLLVGGVAGTSWGMFEARRAWRAEETQRQIAEEHSRVALNHRAQSVELLDLLLGQVHEDIAPLAGSLPVRENLVDTAQVQIERLARWAEEDPTVRHQLATAYERLGDVVGGVRNPNLGRRVEALESYRRGLEILEELHARAPGDIDVIWDLWSAHTKIGDLLRRTQDDDAARASYDDAMQYWKLASDAVPEDPRSQRRLAMTLLSQGDVLAKTGEITAALDHFERSLAMRRALVEADPDDARAQRDLAVACGRMGTYLQRAGRGDEALAYHEENVRIRERLTRRDRDSDRYRRDLITARILFADYHLAAERPTDAWDQIEPALEPAHARLTENPRDARARSDLDWVHYLAGRARAGLEDWPAAIEHWEASLTYAKRRDPEVLRDLAAAYHADGQPVRAAELAREALRLLDAGNDELRGTLEEDMRKYRDE